MGTEKTETQTQEQTQKQSLHQQLRKAKKAHEKIAILEAALEAEKLKAAEDTKKDEERKARTERKTRDRNLYSLGIAVEHLTKTNQNAALKILGSLLYYNTLADKDFARLCEAMFWLKIGIDDECQEKYDKIKDEQNKRAKKMRDEKQARKEAALAEAKAAEK